MGAVLKYHHLEKTAQGRAMIAGRASKPQGKTVGTRLSDRAALGKAIVLSEHYARSFRENPFGYVPHPVHPICQGKCDATGEWCTRAVLFIKGAK